MNILYFDVERNSIFMRIQLTKMHRL